MQHATCVVPLLKTFEPTQKGCKCRKPCFTTEIKVKMVPIVKPTYAGILPVNFGLFFF